MALLYRRITEDAGHGNPKREGEELIATPSLTLRVTVAGRSLALRVTLRAVRIITTTRPFSHPFQTVKTDDCG